MGKQIFPPIPAFDSSVQFKQPVRVKKRKPITYIRITWLAALLALFIALAAGCGEVLNEYFINNHTAQPLTVRLTPNYVDTVDLRMGPLIEDIRPGVHDSLSEAVESTVQDDVIEFTLPPHTSVTIRL